MERILSILLVASTTARKVVVLDDSEWADSVLVTSDPVKITNSRFNPKNNTSPKEQSWHQGTKARMIKECEEGDLKCLYDNQLAEVNNRDPQETIDSFLEKFSSVTNVKINNELRNASSKAYWNQIEAEKHNHPYDDKHGWVTLDPIPYSTSKVSKWKPDHTGDRPWMHGPPQHPPTNWISNADQRPSVGRPPTTQWGLGSNDVITDNRPSNFPLDNGYPVIMRPEEYFPGQQNPAVPHEYQPPLRPQYTQIQHVQPPYDTSFPFETSNRPQPKPSHYPPVPPVHQQSHSQPPYQWQDKFTTYPTHNSIYHQDHYGGTSSSSPPLFGQNHPSSSTNNYSGTRPGFSSHPPSYPEAGQGEWVLLSTTKGYSVPQRYYDRKMHVKQMLGSVSPQTSLDTASRSMKSKYHEHDIDDKFMLVSNSPNTHRKSDNSPETGHVLWNVDGIDIIRNEDKDPVREQKSVWKEPTNTAEHEVKDSKPASEMTFKRRVRLTVLPALNNTSIVSHNGMLEVDANPQTVDEAHEEETRLKKLQSLATVSTGRQPYSVIPVLPRARADLNNRRRAAVIAAVGAETSIISSGGSWIFLMGVAIDRHHVNALVAVGCQRRRPIHGITLIVMILRHDPCYNGYSLTCGIGSTQKKCG